MGKESSNSFYIGLIIISSSIFIYWLNSNKNKKPLKKNYPKIFLPPPEIFSESIDNYDNDNIQTNQNLSQTTETKINKIKKKNKKKIENLSSDSEDDGYQSDISSLADELNYTTIDAEKIPPEYQQELRLSHSELTTESETDSVSRYISTITRVNRYKNLFSNIFSFKSSPSNLPNNQNQNNSKDK